MIECKYDFIILSFEKLLSQLAIETPMVKQSFRYEHEYGVESSRCDLAKHCKISNAFALRLNLVSLLRTSLLNLSISAANSKKVNLVVISAFTSFGESIVTFALQQRVRIQKSKRIIQVV